MNIGIYSLYKKSINEIKKILKNTQCEVLVFACDFLQSKKQIESLLFFDKVRKYCRCMAIVFDIDFLRGVCNQILVFEREKFYTIFDGKLLGGFVLKYRGKKLPFVVGDNIYKKRYKDFVKSEKFRAVVHIDLFGEGYVFDKGLALHNCKIISTKSEGVFELKI